MLKSVAVVSSEAVAGGRSGVPFYGVAIYIVR